ncbi:carboxypeptidase-like regulatory domain-containing protein [bacterium]|nr:carboxypeptidase-like regulatory domain-containing protein [bacterium]
MKTRISPKLPLALLLCTVFTTAVKAEDESSPQLTSVNESVAKAPAVQETSLVQWIKPATGGVLKGDVFAPVLGGAVSVVGDAVIALHGKDGWVAEVETNRLGRFTVTDVEPGAYSLVVKAPGLFALYAIQVIAENEVDTHRYPERAKVSCAFIEAAAVKRMAKHVEGEVINADIEIAAEGVEVNQRGDISRNGTIVATLNDGKLVGAMQGPGSDFIPAVGDKITLVKDGLKVAQCETDAEGKFEIADLEAGVYALVANGKSGVAVFGFEARNGNLPGGQASDATTSESRFVSLLPQQDSDSGSLSFQGGANPLGQESDDDTPATPIDANAAGTNVAGGGGGGGGGVGGAAALLAGAAAAAAAVDGGGGGVVASPATE